MSQRTFTLMLTAAMVVLMLIGTSLEIPQPLLLVVAVGLTLVASVRYTRQRQAAHFIPQAEPDPELALRVRAACARARVTPLPIEVVGGVGRPVLQQREGRLLVSPPLGQLLDDEELEALIRQELGVPPGTHRQAWLESIMPLLGVLVALLLLSAVTGTHLYLATLLIAAVYLPIRAQRGLLAPRTAQRNLRVFQEKGGDAVTLAAALLKVYGEAIRAAAPGARANLAAQMRLHIGLVAAAGELSPAQLEAMAQRLDAPLELYQPGALPLRERLALYRPLIWMGAWVLLLALSVWVAYSLSAPR